jgi:hypothetical protein
MVERFEPDADVLAVHALSEVRGQMSEIRMETLMLPLFVLPLPPFNPSLTSDI